MSCEDDFGSYLGVIGPTSDMVNEEKEFPIDRTNKELNEDRSIVSRCRVVRAT